MAEDLKPLRMSAYYYSFNSTNVRTIDEILSAVAWAGKAAHNTADWDQDWTNYLENSERSPIEFIQKKANDAAKEISTKDAENAALRAELKKVTEDYHQAYAHGCQLQSEVERLNSVASKVMDFAVENDELRSRERRSAERLAVCLEALEKIAAPLEVSGNPSAVAYQMMMKWMQKMAADALSPVPGSQEAEVFEDPHKVIDEGIRTELSKETAKLHYHENQAKDGAGEK